MRPYTSEEKEALLAMSSSEEDFDITKEQWLRWATYAFNFLVLVNVDLVQSISNSF